MPAAETEYDRTEYTGPPVTQASETSVVTRFSPARRAYEIAYLIFAVIVVLLVLRIVLKLLAANTAVAFTAFVYGVTDVLMAPFHGLLPVMASGRTVLEGSAIIAVLVYALVGYLVARIIALMFIRDVTVAQRSRGRFRTF